mmetsp:Transcript_56354/g.63918  ORF Transcript_56354/g.63918 Transcript_56354/m.63918 type:complete len:96 (+) Transcript_56354:183-470(+)|eukprot:CAMPEP_0170919580 /NCGR_PEP_ID=MMETSP0735-20130129/8671_1 /TAXON_ID=186038 /ORGANISM="Fragilariopsis kerguelensis, Strain L26-C5" /LENGTH=95 /DNA_ID=CAMNT_0011318293 /DNA_START=151 /DNA_END=438 /DNA_ORIENTATION=+
MKFFSSLLIVAFLSAVVVDATDMVTKAPKAKESKVLSSALSVSKAPKENITKPPHNRYALSCLDNATYVKYATVYSGCKRWGIRGIYAFLAGTGL